MLIVVFCCVWSASPAIDLRVVLLWSLFGQPLWRIRPSTDSTRHLGVAVVVEAAESLF